MKITVSYINSLYDQKKTIDLINEVVNLGYSKELVLKEIKSGVDAYVRTMDREDIDGETIPDLMYDLILRQYKRELEYIKKWYWWIIHPLRYIEW